MPGMQPAPASAPSSVTPLAPTCKPNVQSTIETARLRPVGFLKECTKARETPKSQAAAANQVNGSIRPRPCEASSSPKNYKIMIIHYQSTIHLSNTPQNDIGVDLTQRLADAFLKLLPAPVEGETEASARLASLALTEPCSRGSDRRLQGPKKLI